MLLHITASFFFKRLKIFCALLNSLFFTYMFKEAWPLSLYTKTHWWEQTRNTLILIWAMMFLFGILSNNSLAILKLPHFAYNSLAIIKHYQSFMWLIIVHIPIYQSSKSKQTTFQLGILSNSFNPNSISLHETYIWSNPSCRSISLCFKPRFDYATMNAFSNILIRKNRTCFEYNSWFQISHFLSIILFFLFHFHFLIYFS
jgi:hypothetical protein